ncbi:bifunctional hydroxymethylpyrimidine kinase/phosphomethylpyrimidine kinase [Undibacterium baiyunense]|uniref:hydroxymethylpyrimidine kinase n=1 Tax=Undibacterium baiyunense TaxID=2828731 RepID=A0A941DGE4_9BURK|nr:hydroxymethylpyrimidine/phosphomethylpyrimidine kinase [Undibacterium baiyunense]MBR7747611.1 hydroxymethylpyrimidine/phosphomethylpyrimidine kinase [Undibacterium baiyunense]
MTAVRRLDQRPSVLVFAGHDPSGGAGIQADIEAISAQGAHALTIITALTVQDNNRVSAVYPVDAKILRAQFAQLLAHIPIAAVKIGIVGSQENANAIAQCVETLQEFQALIPVVVDPVLGSGGGHALVVDDAVVAVQAVLRRATLITPNLPELRRLVSAERTDELKAIGLCTEFNCDVLLKGGHAQGDDVVNSWYQHAQLIQSPLQNQHPHPHQHPQYFHARSWRWPRLEGEFHGTGCTLAASIAAQLALGKTLEESLSAAQAYVQRSLQQAYSIAAGQAIPARVLQKG